MKKVGIVTLDGMFNYGNRLQNYALEQILKKLEFDVNTLIINESKKNSIWNRIYRKISNPKKNFPMIIRRLLKPKNIDESGSFSKMRDVKKIEFSKFQEQHLNNIIVSENIDFSDFYKLIVGSDQVWNPSSAGIKIKNFLTFVPREKRISYAASFGVSEIPDSLKEHYSKHLMEMNKISVREEAGVEIVKSLTGRKAELVLDPTMLLTRQSWEKLIPKTKYKDKPYVLVYVLKGYDEEKQQKLDAFAEENQFEIVYVMGDYYYEEHEVLSPDKFLHAVRDAKMIFTDSFHCGVFSIIMHNPFVIFERNGGNMGSRLETLLSRFKLNGNTYTPAMDFNDIMLNTDFTHIDSILEEGRTHGIGYLKRVLNVEEA